MPSPSMNKMVELGRLVDQVNSLEPKVKELSDSQLRAKTDEFRAYLENKSGQYAQQLEELQQAMLSMVMPEEKEN